MGVIVNFSCRVSPMRSSQKLLLGLILAFQAASASADSLTAWLTSGPTTAVAGATTFDFGVSGISNSGAVGILSATSGGATFSGGSLFNVSTAGISGLAARPVGSTGNFWGIQPGQIGTITFTQGISYFGLLWGSPDYAGWNDLTFYSGDTVIAAYNGTVTQLDKNWANTVYFNVSTTGPLITKVTLTANRPAFEVDNVAFAAPVPEPETYAMLLAGLGLMGFVARRRQNA